MQVERAYNREQDRAAAKAEKDAAKAQRHRWAPVCTLDSGSRPMLHGLSCHVVTAVLSLCIYSAYGSLAAAYKVT